MTNWKTLKLGDVLTLKRGYDLPKQDRVEGAVPIYSSSGLSGYHKEVKVKGPGVVTGRYGTLGEVFYSDEDYWPHNTTLYVKDFKGNHPKFIYYFIQTLGFNDKNDKTSVPGLNRNHLHDLQVSIHEDLSTQRHIAEILSALDDKIELNRRMNQTLEQMAQTLFQKYSEVDEFVPLTELVLLNPKLTLKKGTVSQYVEMSNLSENSASIKKSILREYSGGAKFQNNDTLLARITPCLENGKTGFVDILENNEVGFGSTEYIVMRPKQSISPYFVYCVARDNAFREHAMRSMTGTSGRQRVQIDMLETFVLPKWSVESMDAFHTSAYAAFQKIQANTAEISTLTKLRDTLLPKLMSGEMDVMQSKLTEQHEPILS